MKRLYYFLFVTYLVFVTIVPAWSYPQYAKDNQAQIEEISEILNILELTHISNPDRNKMVTGGIEGIIKTINDPYTMYVTPKIFEHMKNPLVNYVGIGITIDLIAGYPVVISAFPNSPANKAGIEKGDLLLKIENVTTKNLPIEEIIKKIKGEAGTVVKISVQKNDGRVQDHVLTREKISIPNIETNIFKGDVGYIKLLSFSINSGPEFKEAFDTLNTRGINSLIIDLRGNGGGFLESAKEILANFIEKGYAVKIIEANGDFYLEEVNGSNWGKPVIILMDQHSASASEVVAGALQDYNLGKVLGTKSFGKGSMQQTFELKSGAWLKVTTNKWLTPNERPIDGIGIDADYLVMEPTLQLLRAVDILKNTKPSLAYSSQRWLLNNEETYFNLQPVTVNNAVYYPQRFVLEALGFSNTWDAKLKSIKIGNPHTNDNLQLSPTDYVIVKNKAYMSKDILKSKFNIMASWSPQSTVFTINRD